MNENLLSKTLKRGASVLVVSTDDTLAPVHLHRVYAWEEFAPGDVCVRRGASCSVIDTIVSTGSGALRFSDGSIHSSLPNYTYKVTLRDGVELVDEKETSKQFRLTRYQPRGRYHIIPLGVRKSDPIVKQFKAARAALRRRISSLKSVGERR